MKGLRYGLHVNSNAAADAAVDYCARVKPSVMLWLDPDASIIRRCKAASPATEHISRVVFSPQGSSADYRRFIALRQAHAALRSGSIKLLKTAGDVLAFERKAEGEHLLCAFNFGKAAATLAVPKSAALSRWPKNSS